MPELHLKQSGFTYSACGLFIKHRQRIQKLRKTGKLKNLYRNELDKACFTHNAAYSDSKDLTKRIISGKILKDRAHETPKNCRHDRYVCMVYTFIGKKTGLQVSVNGQKLNT